jgi:hypothetical protein
VKRGAAAALGVRFVVVEGAFAFLGAGLVFAAAGLMARLVDAAGLAGLVVLSIFLAIIYKWLSGDCPGVDHLLVSRKKEQIHV